MQNKRNLTSPYKKYFVSNIDLSQAKISKDIFKKISRIFYSFEARKKIKQLIKQAKPDIAHIHNIYHQISPSILGLLKKYNVPIVMTVHDYKLICPNYKLFHHGNICEKCKKRKYYQCVSNKCVKDSYLASALNVLEMYFHKIWRFYEKYVDVFICPSHFMKNKLIVWGLPSSKLITLHHFIKSEIISNRIKEDNYVLYYGRLSEEKGLDLLISLASKLPQIPFKIVGEGPLKKGLIDFCKKNNITNVQFWGYQEGLKLKKLISESRFVVIPSIWQEVFGLTVQEAFNLGKAVIGAKKGGIPELIGEGHTGFLFKTAKELKEKIQYLYENPKIAERMGRNAKKRIKEYSPDIYYDKLIKIYRNLKKASEKQIVYPLNQRNNLKH